jgi:hypothetical protein
LISNKYELQFSALKDKIKEPIKHEEREESLYWEEFGFELMVNILLERGIPFDTTVDDVQPLVKDLNGIEKEIDFRIRIRGNEVFFGVSHFYGRRKDLEKDMGDVDIEVVELRRGEEVIPGKGKIVGVRPQKEYLNRRMAVRVAREGRHKFSSDYIYIFFPKLDRGFGGGLDCISKTFTFSSKANYEYRPFGITGLIVVGNYAEITTTFKGIREETLLVRTLAFDDSSNLMKGFLADLDMNTIDMRDRLEQVRTLLKSGGNSKSSV